MSLKRVCSALIGFPIVAVILIWGNKYVVDIAFGIIAILGIYEYLNCFKLQNKSISIIAYISALLISCIHIFPEEHIVKIVGAIIPISVLILFS